jgi:hypothetical protein
MNLVALLVAARSQIERTPRKCGVRGLAHRLRERSSASSDVHDDGKSCLTILLPQARTLERTKQCALPAPRRGARHGPWVQPGGPHPREASCSPREAHRCGFSNVARAIPRSFAGCSTAIQPETATCWSAHPERALQSPVPNPLICDFELGPLPFSVGHRTSGTPTSEFPMCDLAPIFSDPAPIFSDVGVLHVRRCTSGTRTFEKISRSSDIWNSDFGVPHLQVAVPALRPSTKKVRVRRWGTPPAEFQMGRFYRNHWKRQ